MREKMAAADLSHQHYPQNSFHYSTAALQTWSSNFSSHHHHPHHHYSSSSSSSSTLLKTTKALIQTLIYAQLIRLHRALTKAKAHVSRFISQAKHAKNKYEHKLRLGSFRLHCNWTSSSRVMPRSYDPSTWNISATDSSGAQLTGYLQWLEDHKKEEVDAGDDEEEEEEERFYSARREHGDEDVDKLAELFIASCHEKFLLEKQESYRRFQDMLARSV